MQHVALDAVDGAEVAPVAAAGLGAEPRADLGRFLRAPVDEHRQAMLRAYEELRRAGLHCPLQRHAADGLRLVLAAVHQNALVLELVHLADVPEEQPTVGGHGGALRAQLAAQPADVVDWVIVRDLNRRLADGSGPGAQVVVIQQPVVATAHQHLGSLQVVLARYQRGRRPQLSQRNVALRDVPNERRCGHVVGHPLEAQVRVGGDDLRRALRVPPDLRDAPRLVGGVLEERDGLHRQVLGQVLGLLEVEVVLEQVDRVVLLQASDCVPCELLHGGDEGRVLLKPLPPLQRVLGLRVVDFLRPAALHVQHHPAFRLHPGGVHRMLGKLGDVVHGDAQDGLLYVHVAARGVLLDLAGDLPLYVVEVGVPAEVLPLLHVDVLVLVHGCWG
mmetsp:Transcript_7981/g.22768  ORF Transcript_7981/g.22768 Transcript_7981/m.22768 type:complete len:388 (+) Transcript_7981:584-1747(+)